MSAESDWRDQNDHSGLPEGEKVIVTRSDGDVCIAWLFGGFPSASGMTWWTAGAKGHRMLNDVVAWKRPTPDSQRGDGR